MPLTDPARIEADRAAPYLIELWRALTALRSTVSFMNSGAHPDDETSAMLAALRFRDSIDISYACSTRGEGGQNDIGTQGGAALGTLRTAEMEAACDRLDLRMYWLSLSPDDAITDFGFSKSGVETLAKWGRERTLARFVDIVRRERPDILCPTFLDISGQHGHHRAMTEAAHTVMDLAADDSFPDSSLPAWEVSKLYLPAWSGAGQAYDDDLPPPPATLTVAATGKDPVTGWPYARIGQQSRAMHKTQAMGRWVAPGDEIDFPLHLAATRVSGPDTAIASGLPATLADLDAPEIADDLSAATDACSAAIAAFPDGPAVLREATTALKLLRAAREACPEEPLARIAHKLSRKEAQLANVIRLSSGVQVRGYLAHDILRPGASTTLHIESDAQAEVTPDLPDEWSLNGDTVTLSPEAAISDPYPPVYLPDTPSTPCLSVTVEAHGVESTSLIRLERTPVIVPACSAALSPERDVINIAADRRQVTVRASDIAPPEARPGLAVPEGWTVDAADREFTVRAPDALEPGHHQLTLTLDGTPATTVEHISHPHIEPRALTRPAQVRLAVINATIPEVRVGYIGGGNDRVCHWLSRMGVDVVDLSEVELTKATLNGCDTIVIGIFAMKFRPGLANAMPLIHDWTSQGGTLVTLYHRPWDNWDPQTVPPKMIEIGQPSLRWRVTDENAEVRVLRPDHALFNFPNVITAEDWTGWHKERGLYFAARWAEDYTPLISMNDVDEKPLEGALLTAEIGDGRHIHTSLILHHQMEHLVPGAYRIMANLLAKRN